MSINRILVAYKLKKYSGFTGGNLFLCFLILLIVSCSQQKEAKVVAPWGVINDTISSGSDFDLEQIVSNGEMIMLTLSGPESYYDYHGRALGVQYLLCQRFADKIGVSLRVELCRDTMEMLRKLIAGDADVIAYPLSPGELSLPKDTLSEIIFCGAATGSLDGRWSVCAGKPLLAKALDEWYNVALLSEVKKEESFLLSSKSVRRRVYAPMQNRKAGIISRYDGLFMEHSRRIRWDWRLMAAQCYQESTFDPEAKSWAGACGLMQIMPATASHLGLAMSEIYVPERNIEAAGKYLGEIESKFGDIPNRYERINFTLASYNGGYHHIRDAMRLAKKSGKNPMVWEEVAKFVLLLSDPKYYRDPDVKYGYMRGCETVDYVAKIRQRWQQYRGVKSPRTGFSGMTPRKARHNKKKYKLSTGG